MKKTGLPSHWITELFKKFQARYGHKWTSAIEGIEETAVKEWSEGLAGLTGDQIKYGLDHWSEGWPPSMTEFVDCCKDTGDWRHNTAAYKLFDRSKALPLKKAQESVVNESREKLKGLGLLK